MGAVCCCLQVSEEEHEVRVHTSNNRHRSRSNGFRNFVSKFTAPFTKTQTSRSQYEKVEIEIPESMIEEEQECPICLEEYTQENPRIKMKCFHSYHLACIYEWFERSNLCPICNRVMELRE